MANPSPSTAEAMALPRYDGNSRPDSRPGSRSGARTQLLGAGTPPPPVFPTPGSVAAQPPSPVAPPVAPPVGTSGFNPPQSIFSSHSVSIMMPAPDGSMMAPLSQGPPNYVIVRHNKRHGPYDLAQLERLIPMGKLRSVDSIEVQSNGEKALAVDLPGLRPLFEARAQSEQASVVRPPPTSPVAVQPDSRSMLWTVIGLLAASLITAAVLLALRS